MIQINLLPPEYRAKTGTPVARFVAIVSGVVVLACASGAYAYTHFIELAKVRELRQTREEEALGQERRKKHSLDLQAEIDLYEKRRAAIQTVNRSRTLWSRKLDQFFDIVTNQGTDETYKVWIESLEVPPQLVAGGKRAALGKKGQPADGGQFKFSGFLAMESESEWLPHVSAFHKALTGDPESTGRATDFFADFMRVNNPNGKIVGTQGGKGEEELTPPVVGSFDYELTLLPKAQPDAAKTPAAKSAKASRNKAGN
jgi:hypothetical protein